MKFAGVDQLADGSTFNREVAGSLPAAGTRFPGLAAEDRTLTPGRMVRLHREAFLILVPCAQLDEHFATNEATCQFDPDRDFLERHGPG